MVRISDILKKKHEQKEEQPPQQPTQEEKSASEPAFQEEPKPEKKTEAQPESGVSISSVIINNSKVLIDEEPLKLYQEAVDLVKAIYDNANAGKKITQEEQKGITAMAEKFVNQLSSGNDNILNLVNLVSSGDYGDYIYSHSVNVCILAVDVGIGLGCGRAELMDMGITALLHDIGMLKFKDLYDQMRNLTETEYNTIKNHPVVGSEIIKELEGIDKRIASFILHVHERMDGSGYPWGLKGDAITLYGRVMGAVDVYEAITHLRPYRDNIHPCEVMKQLVDSKKYFDRRIMKVLIERIASPFPVGSYVQLSSGEKARVIKRNLDCLLRPTVAIIYDANGERLEKTTIVELGKYPTTYIKNCLKEEQVQ